MNLHWVDWSIIIGFLFFITVTVTYTRRYVKGVADFLAANRCAGRYLLGVSEAGACLGAISLVAWYEAGLQSGFTFIWWSILQYPAGIIIAVSGWVIYRFRQTRSLTLAEFLEKRYSRKFRLFCGVIIFISGILNFGIFPAISAKFFMNFCGFASHEILFFNWFTIDLTYALVMAVLLIISLYFTCIGGHIGITLTDFVQGIFSSIILGVVAFFVFMFVCWGRMEEVLVNSEHVHMIDPFKGANIPDFNVWYFVMAAVLSAYACRAWQGSQAYNCAALTPHEAKMASIVNTLRGCTIILACFLLPVAVYVIMRHPDFARIASQANLVLDRIGNETTRNQMTVPTVMSIILPKGLLGCFAAIFLAAFVASNIAYMHSWGSIFIQDVVLPFRKKAFNEKQHMLLLRLSISGVVVFIYIFSLAWTQTEAILLWFQITAAIWLGGAGAVIIGGLYWKKGTTAGAYSAVIIGGTLALTGIAIQQLYKYYWPDKVFFLNGMEISFLTAVISCLVYGVVSLCNNRNDFNLDEMLHRGQYALADDVVDGNLAASGIFSKLGLTGEFTKRDKFLFFFAIGFSFFWVIIFVIGTIYNYIYDVKAKSWMNYWWLYTLFMFAATVVYVVWMSIGGFMDIKKMFIRLSTLKRNEHDDGWVKNKNSGNDLTDTPI